MKDIFLIFFGLIVLNSCQSPQLKTKHNSRHGWTVFSGQKSTSVKTNSKTSLLNGQKLYVKNCLRCHGPKGKGNGPWAKGFQIKPADLSKLSKRHNNSFILYQVNEGKGSDMPKWKDLLSSKETWDLSNYVLSLGKN